MKLQTSKSFVIKKTAQMSFWGLVSRLMGIAREILQAQFLGVSGLSDAFLGASEIPNRFRKIFEDGGITSALVPQTVRVVHQHGKSGGSELISGTLFFFEFFMLLCCGVVWVFPELVVKLVSPGFADERMPTMIHFLKLMFPSLIFLAGSSIAASGLQAINHFFIPAMGPALYNSVYLIGLGACLGGKLSVDTLALTMVTAASIKFLSRLWAFYRYGFKLVMPTRAHLHDLKVVMWRFLPALLSFGALEFSFLLNKRWVSFLAKGSVSLLYYAERFSMLPHSIIGVALASVLLPHFSSVAVKNPRRLRFLFFESSKLALWFALPCMAFMMFLATPLFADLMLKGRATPHEIATASELLALLLLSFPFRALNKIIKSLFYAKNDTAFPLFITIFSMFVGNACNYFLIGKWGIFAISFGMFMCEFVECIMLGMALAVKHTLALPLGQLLRFVKSLLLQFFVGASFFLLLYGLLAHLLSKTILAVLISQGAIGYWVLVLTCFGLTMLALWRSHRIFGLRLYLLPS